MATFFRRHKIISILGGILAAIILALILIVVFSETIIRNLATRKGGEALGRELAIEGPLHIEWHWQYTKVHIEKIRLGNAPGYTEPDMLTIETLDFSFRPLKALVGRLEFGDIVFQKPFLVLDRKSLDDTNWDFPVFSKANVATEVVAADDRHDFPIIQRLALKEGKLIFRDDLKNLDLNVKLDTVSGEGGDNKDETTTKNQFRINGKGTLQKQKFEIAASGGSLEYLRDSSQDFPLTLKLTMGDTQVQVKGTFKDPIKLTGVNASLNITGNNLADLFYLTAIPLPPTPPYTLGGTLTKTGTVWGYSNFKGKVGGSDLSGDLSYDVGSPRGFFKAKLLSNLMDSKDLGGFIGLPPSGENAAPEQQQAAAEKKASPNLIPDVPLKLERLRATDLDVTLQAIKIVAPSLPFKGMQVRFLLKNGLLTLDPLQVTLADGTIDGSIEIDANDDIPPMKANLNLRELSLGQFFLNTRFAQTTQGFFGGTVKLAGKGASLADVLGASNGDINIIMVGGKVSLLLIEASDLDLAQALPLFFGKDKSTPIRCAVGDFGVKSGVLTSKIVVFDTEDSLLTGNVNIDLKQELISARLDSKPKDASFFSVQTPIKLEGKLKQPEIGIETRKAGNRGIAAAALGVLLTPFAAIVPFIEKGDAQNADCRALINQAKQ